MGYPNSMTIIEGPNGYLIGLTDDTLYNPESSDNVVNYDSFYSDKIYRDYLHLTKHGVYIFKDEEIEKSACICSSGGKTGIHPTCLILEDDRLLICCAHSIFCLTVPELYLSWTTKADHATCFEVFKYRNGYIIHGELEISLLD
jgi:hypothetical protein